MKFNQSKMYEQPPPGSHIARLVSMVDLGTQQHTYQDRVTASRDVRLGFELPLEKMVGKYDPSDKGKPFGVTRTVTQSLHPKAKLRELLEGWRSKKFTKEEIAAFDPKTILGKSCRLTLVQDESGEYTNLQSIAAIGKSEKVPKQINPSTYFSLEPDEFDEEVFNGLGPATKEKIMRSPEYAKLMEGAGGGGEQEQEQHSGHEQEHQQPVSDDVPF